MALETKIKLLKEKCSKYETVEFLTFIAGALLQIPTRHRNPILKKLMSPMRQLFFLGYLNTLKNSKNNQKGFSEDEWNEMANLLHEIELEYFYLLGFPKEGKETKEDLQRIKVTMPTFMNYFFNGPLAYQEQEIERIESIFSSFNDNLKVDYNLGIADFINFYDLVGEEINRNVGKTFKFMNNEAWQAFTKQCIDKGLNNPKDWINEAPDEINAYFNFMQNPGSFLKLDLNKLSYKNISRERFERILKIFTYRATPSDDIVYYTEENPLMAYPIIRLDELHFMPFFVKQYLNACYNFLFNYCSKINKSKLLKQRDLFVESKVLSLFQEFFGKEASIFSNYSIDNNKSEQDILILFKGLAFIIEVKAGSYRAPMRDPEKAYDKLKFDFKTIIQNAYDQTLRVKDAFWESDTLVIKNKKKQKLYDLKTKKYRHNLFSIIVPLERFGNIQTDLNELLNIHQEDNFPWAVSLDDLEAFLLTLSRRKNKIPSFIQYLRYRENYHGHLICSDELELCGFFLKDPQKFMELSLKEEMIVTDGDQTEPIEKAYYKGMGFKNERNLMAKRDKHTSILYGI